MSYVVLDSVEGQNQAVLREQFALDVLTGLSAADKFLPSKYFYDARGSRIFERITDLPEYYPTRCEFEILETLGAEVVADFGDRPFDVVELGAGDGRKTKVLLNRLLEAERDFSYIPVDISEAAVAGLVADLKTSHPSLTTRGIVSEYFDSIRYLGDTSDKPKLVLFLGSNIGNFDAVNALHFLRALWQRLKHGDLLLVGFDLKKDIDVMLRAYSDPAGVTRDFNLNVLRRINEELDGDFELERFMHHALYNPVRGAMESYLVAREAQQVTVGALERRFSFTAFEPVHLEYSYKYLMSDIERLAAETGCQVLHHWRDAKGWFVDSLWRVNKQS